MALFNTNNQVFLSRIAKLEGISRKANRETAFGGMYFLIPRLTVLSKSEFNAFLMKLFSRKTVLHHGTYIMGYNYSAVGFDEIYFK